MLSDGCKDISSVAYLEWKGLGKSGAWSCPQGPKSHTHTHLVRSIIALGFFSLPRSAKVSFGCLSLTGDMRYLVQSNLFLIHE